jgi:hypothetical protein
VGRHRCPDEVGWAFGRFETADLGSRRLIRRRPSRTLISESWNLQAICSPSMSALLNGWPASRRTRRTTRWRQIPSLALPLKMSSLAVRRPSVTSWRTRLKLTAFRPTSAATAEAELIGSNYPHARGPRRDPDQTIRPSRGPPCGCPVFGRGLSTASVGPFDTRERRQRTMPLIGVDHGDGWGVIASAGGHDTHQRAA